MNYANKSIRGMNAMSEAQAIQQKQGAIGAALGTMEVPTQTREGEIDLNLTRLSNSIASLQSISQELSNRLAPILNQSESGNPGTDECRESSASALGGVLADMIVDCNRLYSFLSGILNSIEL